MIVVSDSLGLQWLVLPLAASIIDAVVLFKLRDKLMRIGGFGPYKRDWWRQSRVQ
jgi:hypothetical protein